MKNQKKTLALLISLSALTTSCVSPCSSKYTSDLNAMKDAFKSAYKSSASAADLTKLQNAINNFIANQNNVSCTLNGSTMNITAEVKSLQAELAAKSSSKVTAKVVYGTDNRQEVSHSASKFQVWAESTAAQIPKSNIDSSNYLIAPTLQASLNLCPGESYANELTAARCSGFLISPTLLVTAGHCMETAADCTNNYWVFDYYDGVNQVDSQNIYSCKNVIKQELVYTSADYGADYAVVELDRAVTNRSALPFRVNGKIADSTNLVVIGNPSGLPTKVADGAVVRSNTPTSYFVANLDTFAGNSGSAVIDVDTGVVEGVLVRGDNDYVLGHDASGNACYKVNVCSSNGCSGESVTRMTEVQGTGVAKIASQSEVINGIFNKSYSSSVVGGALPVFAYNYDGMVLAGRKFLDLCGLHLAKSNSTGVWIDQFVGDCSNSSVQASLYAELFKATSIIQL